MKTNARLQLLLVMVSLGVLAAACSGGKDESGDDGDSGFVTPTPDPNAHAWVQEAQVTYPRLLDLQQKVFSNTCSPNPNVCHNSSNYPQLRTAGATVAAINSPCNVEIPDRTQGWDNCERPGDVLYAGSSFVTRVAWIDRIGPQTWRVGMEQPPEVTASVVPRIVAPDGETILNTEPAGWDVTIALVENTAHAMVTVNEQDEFLAEFLDAVLATVIGGDPNENGVWGADDLQGQEGAIVYPGDLSRSYLWGRITGTVPGSRMPLANTPITNAGYVAIACWIEGLSPEGEHDPDDLIDYDTCTYADAPVDYETTE